MRSWTKTMVPLWLRVELRRLLHMPVFLLERPAHCRRRASAQSLASFAHVLARQVSPLSRGGELDDKLQRGKEQNLRRAAALLDRVLIDAAGLFSYHQLVGRPSRLRGFRAGLELGDGQLRSGVGGGCCQISNALFLVALQGGMKIVERHRHGLDLFPDHQRTVPFGCGATVFYNYRDLRFENPLAQPVLLRLAVLEQALAVELRSLFDPGLQIEIREDGHHFFREQGQWMRENRIRRRILDRNGMLLLDEEVAHNRARVLYEPRPDPLDPTREAP